MSDIDEISGMFAKVAPQRFDRIAAKDVSVFESFAQAAPHPANNWAGIQVVTDEAMPTGIVELRKGDEVIGRLVVSW